MRSVGGTDSRTSGIWIHRRRPTHRLVDMSLMSHEEQPGLPTGRPASTAVLKSWKNSFRYLRDQGRNPFR